jgi:hypothetical protein
MCRSRRLNTAWFGERKMSAARIDTGRMQICPGTPRNKRGDKTLLQMLPRICAAVIVLLASACSGPATPSVNYKPALLPLQISVGPGGVSISGDRELVTPIGVFSIGAQYSLQKPSPDSIYVILRMHATKNDSIYRVRAGQDTLTVIVDGHVKIQVHNDQVLIDVAKGATKTIQFEHGESAIPETQNNDAAATWWHDVSANWNKGYHSTPYKPFMLSRWAYDDSDMGRWYGVGFLWFMVRLALAIVLGVFDVILSIVWLLGQVLYLIFGPTGRNVVWGLALLPVFVFVFLFVGAVARD